MQHDDKQAAKAHREAVVSAQVVNADIDAAITVLLAERKGRRFLWWLLGIGEVHGQPFTTNALTTSFNCGKLDVGNQILARITQVDPAGFVRMQQEQADVYGKSAAEPDRTAADSGPGGVPGAYDL